MQKFKLQIIGTISSVIILTVVILATLSYQSFKAESIKLNKALLREENRAIETELVEKFDAYRRELSSISISASDITQEGLSERARNQLNTLYNMQQGICNNTFLFMKNGDAYCRDGKKIAINVKDEQRAYYKAIFEQGKEFYISAPYIASSNGQQVFGVVHKITDNIAVLSSIHTDVILNPLANKRGMFMYTEDGTILSTQYPDLLGKNIFEVRPAYKKFSESNPEIVYQIEINGVVDNYMAFWSKLDINGWGYVTYVKSSRVYEAADNQLKSSIIVGVISLLIVIIILLIIIYTMILKPVGGAPKEIAELMDQMIAGETPRLEHSGKETGIYKALINISNQRRALDKDLEPKK